MTDSLKAAISVENVSKSFLLRRNRTGTLRDRLSLGRLNNKGAALTEEFWALRDVSFAVQPGQSVGIVGHNGSGKSTMLKILTGIMKPTNGAVRVKGRVGALIEVGAGFHPDLSGRENIFLNGSILGLSRRDIAAKFDEIVAFANLEKFIDTPVKRYSSGMYMRLGFSIAVHTDPDVLLIDEVLAVGDTLFQRKCIRRLEEFVNNGGAAIFVSHAMTQVAGLCKTCVWLDHGQARYIGETEQAIEHYMQVVSEREDAELKRQHPEEWAAAEEERLRERERAEREREEAEREARKVMDLARRQQSEIEEDYDRPRFLGVTLRDSKNRPSSHFRAGDELSLRLSYQFIDPPSSPVFAIEFHRSDGLYMFATSNFDHQLVYDDLPLQGDVVIGIEMLTLNPGRYRVRVRLFEQSDTDGWSEHPSDVVDNAAEFFVDPSSLAAHGTSYIPVHWQSPAGREPEPAELLAIK